MNKLKEIRRLAEEAIGDYEELGTLGDSTINQLEYGRYELGQEILEILSGEQA